MEAQEVHNRKAAEGRYSDEPVSLQRWLTLHSILDAKKTAEEKEEEADAEILNAIASRRKLASDLELAKGVQYTKPMKTRQARSCYGTLQRTHISAAGFRRNLFGIGQRSSIADCEKNTIFSWKAKMSHLQSKISLWVSFS